MVNTEVACLSQQISQAHNQESIAHVDQLKCLGDGQVLLVAATAFRLLRQRLGTINTIK